MSKSSIFCLFSWLFFTDSTMGASPSNYHLGEDVFTFSKHLKQVSKSKIVELLVGTFSRGPYRT